MAPFAIREKDGLRFGYFPAWEKLGVGHAFTCRTGGESDNLEGILNMGLHSGDNPEKVVRNRQKVAKALGFDLNRTVTCNQVHSTHIVRVTEADAGKGRLPMKIPCPKRTVSLRTAGTCLFYWYLPTVSLFYWWIPAAMPSA